MKRSSVSGMMLYLVAMGGLPSCPALADPVDKVVTIYTKIGTKESGQGTGFFIGRSGEIVTAYHVIKDATEITVFDSKDKRQGNERVLALLPRYDLALLRVDTSPSREPLEWSTNVPPAASKITVVGSPRGLANQTLVGSATAQQLIPSLSVSLGDGKPAFRQDIQIMPVDITVNNGMSGAPALNASGSVVGVLSGSYAEGGGIAWLIPTQYMVELLQLERKSQSAESSITWPAFELMAPGWKSLKRSYSANFSAAHIQKLEILESVFTQISGAWKADRTVKTEINTYMGGECHQTLSHEGRIEFQDVSATDGAIVGTFRLTTQYIADFTPAPTSNPIFTSSIPQEACYQQITGSKDNPSRATDLSGEFSSKARDRRGKTISFRVNVTDCKLDTCGGGMYGEADAGVLEIVSKDVITLGELVFNRT